MPKMKIHSGAAKRFRFARRTRRLSVDLTVAPADVRKIKKLLAK